MLHLCCIVVESPLGGTSVHCFGAWVMVTLLAFFIVVLFCSKSWLLECFFHSKVGVRKGLGFPVLVTR